MNTWFTSDTHYGHKNIIGYCGRPFASVEDMDETMIERWNKVVKPEDHVLHLGDVMMGQNLRERLTTLRARLNGHITLLLGNHDRGRGIYLDAGFNQVERQLMYKMPDGRIAAMRHHPPLNEYGDGYIHLCGHVHEKWKRRGKTINVGVDQWNFTPVSLEELLAA